MCRYSFVVPVYNVKPEFLAQCLDSILVMDSAPLEVVLVDDRSSNGCEAMCDDYQARDSRVRVFHLEENAGVSHARNFGIGVARGDWIIFVDSDDWVDPSLCSRLSEVTADDVDIVVYSAYRDSVGSCLPFGTTACETLFSREAGAGRPVEELSENILRQNLNAVPPSYDTVKYCWGKAFRKAFLDRSGVSFPELSYCEDIVFMASAFQKADKVVQIPERFYHYRVSASSTVNSFRKNAPAEQERFLRILNERIGDDGNDTIYYAALLSMQICLTRFLYNRERRAGLIRRHREARRCFAKWPYSDVFRHVDIAGMKRTEKWKATLIRLRLYLLYYLGTEARKIKSVRFQ